MNNSAKVDEFVSAMHSNAKVVEPSENSEQETSHQKIFSNFEFQSDGSGKRKVGLGANEVLKNLVLITGKAPIVIGEVLYAVDIDSKLIRLSKPAQLFAWLSQFGIIDWSRQSDCISKEEFLSFLIFRCAKFSAIEEVPHFPELEDVYYFYPPLPDTNGEYLEELINFFSPETPLDRQLIIAFVLTLFWGGAPGTRPMFLITGPEHDSEPSKNGRGSGKSTLGSVLSDLVGGSMSFTANQDFEKVKTRILSSKASGLRVAILDNVKTRRLSWDDLEGLITMSIVSGHAMFQGEGRRPNSLIWVVTLNGATLSKDLAQRCIIINLKRPTNSANWKKNVQAFIKQYRWHIISDVKKLLTDSQ